MPNLHPSKLTLFLLGLFLLAPPVHADDAPANLEKEPNKKEREKGVVSLMFENDLLYSADSHYTHGTRLSFYTGEIGQTFLKDGAESVPFVEEGGAWRMNFALGQNIYTPEDITKSELQKEERPYAGWTYLGFGLIRAKTKKSDIGKENAPLKINAVELQVGIVGPDSRADDIQTWIHSLDLIGDPPEPKGWAHQLHNELGVNLYSDWQWIKPLKAGSLTMDMIPHIGAAAGNVDIHLGGGLTFRVGPGLKMDNGPPRIRPSLPGAGYFKRPDGFSHYFFVGAETRYVARNIFLDGNTFQSSHSVSKEPVVVDLQTGFVFAYKALKITWTNIFRSKEFEGQRAPDRFSALSVSVNF